MNNARTLTLKINQDKTTQELAKDNETRKNQAQPKTQSLSPYF